jgi:transcriptional regulator with XRE-family HTH domain
MTTVKYFLAIGRLYMAMTTSTVNRVSSRLTSADVMRQLSKEIRDVFGSRKKFSDALGVSDDTIGNYIRNERQMPADMLFQAIDLLGLDEATFFTRARATRQQPPKGV